MTVEETVDLLIIGSGAGSMAAALRAVNGGFSVMILEKQDLFGGSTAVSGGVLWVPCTSIARRAGAEDSPADALAYFDACLGPETRATSRARRDAFLQEGPHCLDFLETLGMRWAYGDGYSDYHEAEYPGGSVRGRAIVAPMFDLRELGSWTERISFNLALPPVMFQETVPLRSRGRTWASKLAFLRVAWRMLRNRLGARLVGMGPALYGRLFQQAVKRGVNFRSGVRVRSLLTNGGRVTGAEVEWQGRMLRINARRGVLLNSGGFALNAPMRDAWQPQPTSVDWTLANPGDTGEMIEMVRGLGGALDLMDAAWWLPGTILPSGTRLYLVPELQQPHGFVVDSSGQRFMNEATSYVAIGRAIYERQKTVPAVPSWLIMDRQYMEKYWIVGRSMKSVPRIWLDIGIIVEAPSLAELAAKCGLPADTLEASTTRFNGFARSGVDEDFGRGRSAYHRLFGDPLHKPTPGLGAVEKPPFYAMPFNPADVGTAGGLLTDEHARVLRDDGSPIEGLYATGNCTATVMGHSYPGAGASIAPSLVFGYIAAGHAIGGDR
jgi:3-oxosteroid 1-dehydrogenase